MHGEKGNGIVTIRKKSFVLVLAIAFFVGMSATMGAVSYTHLDVYKIQRIDRG